MPFSVQWQEKKQKNKNTHNEAGRVCYTAPSCGVVCEAGVGGLLASAGAALQLPCS